ncbi:CBS domain-containing protein [Filifactor villosus]|uniref:CBS domain-containing protein n=1 Tax=Filifactor villosus TaxID=29374 RepID=A0ABV9QJJ8_9FIRM
MIIRSIMTPESKLKVLSPNLKVKEALDAVLEDGFLSLPVVQGKKYIGIFYKNKVYDAIFSDPQKKEEILNDSLENWIISEALPLHELDYVERAAEKFSKNNWSFIPVVNKLEEFVGIVTQKAIFQVVVRVYGLEDARLIIHSYDFVGVLSNITKVIQKHGANITNVTQYDTDIIGITEISIRLKGENLDQLVKKLKAKGIKVHEFIEKQELL